MQNTSHAVMAQRWEPSQSSDDFPTPPWATRAFIEHFPGLKEKAGELSCLEPACGRGYMAEALKEYFGSVGSSDVNEYGYGTKRDFLAHPPQPKSFDWVITNPPFNKAKEFVLTSLDVARVGVAVLVRTAFVESQKRYEELFSKVPPRFICVSSQRILLLKSRIQKKGSTATSYSWFVWEPGYSGRPEIMWIPPCRRDFERDSDYPTR